MAIISYAGNHEDVVLARCLDLDLPGFWVDIGASDPVAGSVTKLFSDHGWRGLNVEPSPEPFAALSAARPDDINVRLGVAAVPGTATFYNLAGEWNQRSTFDATRAAEYDDAGHTAVLDTVEVTTLAHLWEEHVGDRRVDFLKIDVEGGELGVLRGADFARFRPRFVLVEATEPGSPKPSHAEWEPLLIQNGYLFALFDGLNRFYVREEDAELLPCLSAPASALDEFVAFETEHWRLSAERAEHHLAAAIEANEHAQAHIDHIGRRFEQELAALNAHTEALGVQLADTSAGLAATQAMLEAATEDLLATRRRAMEAQVRADRLAADLDVVLSSALMRAIRWARRRLSVLKRDVRGDRGSR